MTATARDYARLRNIVFGLSLLAWLVLLRPVPAATGAARMGGPQSVSWCGTAMPIVAPAPSGAALTRAGVVLQHTAAPALTWAWMGAWAIMLVAMMLPTLVQPLYHIRLSCFSRRRMRASALFVAGYGVVWLAAGAALWAVAVAVSSLETPAYLLAVGAATAALVWQVSPLKQRCLNRGHRHGPLAAFGVRADWDALRMGLTHGGWCTGSCWAAMLLPLLLGHGHLWAMAAVSLLVFCERLDPPRTPAWRWRGFETACCYVRLYFWGPRRSPAPASTLIQA
ncbi:hypothetical protein GCM10022409_20580 [Hymenobacter glaciei]|uniref:Metal-binding protein n=1 Tax=Hymenobacter glaciei TaxID=877209 RepID=A0ABP7U427_9BACT